MTNPLPAMFLWMFFDPCAADLIEKMDDSSWKVREAAYKKLASVGENAAFQLKIASKHHESLEVRKRSTKLLRMLYRDIKPSLDVDEMPQIDMLPEDYPYRQHTIKKYLDNCNLNLENGDWKGRRLATLQFARELYDRGKKKQEIIELLDKMVLNERKWWKENSIFYNPPTYIKPRGY